MILPGMKKWSQASEPRKCRFSLASYGCTAHARAPPPAAKYKLFRRGRCFTSSARLCARIETKLRASATTSSGADDAGGGVGGGSFGSCGACSVNVAAVDGGQTMLSMATGANASLRTSAAALAGISHSVATTRIVFIFLGLLLPEVRQRPIRFEDCSELLDGFCVAD